MTTSTTTLVLSGGTVKLPDFHFPAEQVTTWRVRCYRKILITLIFLILGLCYAHPRSFSARPAFHTLVMWAILSPSNCIM